MISFVIPAHNERIYIHETVTSIRQVMKGVSDFEIIVVDNASTDGTTEVISAELVDKIITLPTQVSISTARNIGANASSGKVLAFIDADVLITNSWANAVVTFEKKVEQNPYLISGCKVVISKKPSWIESVWFSNMKNPVQVSYINSGNLVTTRDTFQSISGFDESMTTGEDVDFCIRAKKAGALIVQDVNFIAHHEGYPKTIKRFFAREQWHGIGDIQTLEKFLSSKVAIFSCGILVLLIFAIILLISHNFLASLLLLLLATVINTLAIYKRFNVQSFYSFLSISFLHFLYSIARCTSLFAKHKRRAR